MLLNPLLDEELALLNQLDELGLPTVNASRITVDGQPALLFDRFAQGSKEVVRTVNKKVEIVGSSKYLNERSVADLRSIRQAMVNNNIRIPDLQFLIGRDGRIVIADPLKPITRQRPSPNNLKTIDRLIEAASR